MYKNLIFIVIITLCVSLLSCSDAKITPPDPHDPSPAEKQIIDASNEFAFNLFKEVNSSEADTNILVSPLSVSYALGMTYNGANGQTETDMAATLGFGSLTNDEINLSYQTLTEALTTLDPSVIFEIANSIWIRNGFPVEQDFIDVNQDFFDAEVASLNFDDDNSVDIINGWISDKTHEKIKDVLQPPISPAVIMYLINAIYFNGTWTYQFDPDNTFPGMFIQTKSRYVDCDYMEIREYFPSLITDDFSAVDLPYGNQDYGMTIFKPRHDKTLDDFLSLFNQENFTNWMAALIADTITVKLPKFKFGYGIELGDVLTALGMGIAFNPGLADFSGITPAVQLYISRVIHKTFIQVDERGTEAAAVTIVEIEYTSIQEEYFTFDRPFVFVIHEKNTGAILFIGKVTNPIWEE